MSGCCGHAKPLKRSWRWLLRGVIGVIKAKLRINRAPDAHIQERVRICMGNGPAQPPCPEFRDGWLCNACGCVVNLKIRVKSEHCPRGLW